MRRLLTGLLGATLLLGACGDDGGDDDRAAATSIPDDTTTSSTTTEARVPPPDVIPRDVSLITEEYVEQVLDALFVVDLRAVESARSEGVVGEEAIRLIEATSTEEAGLQRINDLLDLAATNFPGIAEPPKALTFEVRAVLEATSSCVVAEVRADSTGMFPDSQIPENAREFLRLRSAARDQLATGLNPTAWVMDLFPVTLDGTVPDLSCDQ